MTLQLMMMRHYTKFVMKGSAGLKVSSKQSFTDILELCCGHDLTEHNTPIFSRLWLLMMYDQTKFDGKKID